MKWKENNPNIVESYVYISDNINIINDINNINSKIKEKQRESRKIKCCCGSIVNYVSIVNYGKK